MYAAETRVGTVLVASVSLTLLELCLVDLGDYVLLVSSLPSNSYSLSCPSSVEFLIFLRRNLMETSMFDSLYVNLAEGLFTGSCQLPKEASLKTTDKHS